MRPIAASLLLLALAATGCDTTGPPVTEPPEGERRYSDEDVTYFLEVALGSEFGGSGAAVRRWAGEVRIATLGSPTAEDVQTLEAIVADVNDLVESVDLVLTDATPSISIHFLPPDEFAAVEPNYVPGNLGFFWVNWTGACRIYRSRVLITTEGVTQAERSHLIREELTQSLGLMRDSDRYPESVFYAPWTDVMAYAPIDRTVIEMLHRPEVQPCMTAAAARRALEAIRE